VSGTVQKKEVARGPTRSSSSPSSSSEGSALLSSLLSPSFAPSAEEEVVGFRRRGRIGLPLASRGRWESISERSVWWPAGMGVSRGGRESGISVMVMGSEVGLVGLRSAIVDACIGGGGGEGGTGVLNGGSDSVVKLFLTYGM